MTREEWIGNGSILIYIIKILVISIFTYITSIKISNIKINKKYMISSIIIIIINSIICGIINKISDFSSSIVYLVFTISSIFSLSTKNKIGYSILINIISISINYCIFLLSTILSFILYSIIEIKYEYINFIIITLIYSIILTNILKYKKIKYGIDFLDKNKNNNYFDILVLNISIIILFSLTVLINVETQLKRDRFTTLIIFSIIMFITIQKSLQLYYKQQLQQREIEEMKKEIKQKDEEISKLEQENLNFSKTSHSIAHKQKSLEHKLNQLIMKNETAEEIDIKDRINNIQSELNKNTIVQLKETGIEQIDDMLKYMQSECTKNKIDFDLKINGNIHHMTNKYVEKETLEILLADLIKNAIIAINYSKNINKSILVKLGIIDGIYSIYVYDSGIEFEINTLINLGKKPSTTHADSGGTGMGFMNTFDSLNKYNASIQINEIGKESKDNYTKYIAIKFDNKHEFKINSYRKEEIEKLNNNKDIILENKN